MPTNISLKPGVLRPGDKVTLTVGAARCWEAHATVEFVEASSTCWLPIDTVLEVTRPERMVEVPESFIDDVRRGFGNITDEGVWEARCRARDHLAALDEQATP